LETPGLFAQLRRQRLWVAVGVVVASIATTTPVVAIGVLPPSINLKQLAHATASTQLVVGANSSFGHPYPDLYDRNLAPRAAALADMIASPRVRSYVGRAAAVPASEIAVDTPLWTQLQRIQQWATGEKRANEIIAEKDPYRITLTNDPYAPVVDVIAQAPSTQAAARLAHGVVEGLRTYVSDLATTVGTPLAGRYVVGQLAPVTVDPASTTGLANVGAFTFLAVFVLWCGLVLFASGLARDICAAATSSQVHGGLSRSSGSEAKWTEAGGPSTSAG
jgi:hypothetical protein